MSKFILLCFFVLISLFVFSQAPGVKSIIHISTSPNHDEALYDLQLTSDKGFVAVGVDTTGNYGGGLLLESTDARQRYAH
jgi:hypothetical protein